MPTPVAPIRLPIGARTRGPTCHRRKEGPDESDPDHTAVALAALAIALLVLLACSAPDKTVDTASLGPATTILVYDNGHIVSERAVAPGSDEDRAVQDWLRSHPDGWRSDWNTYAPRRYVKGTRFTLNFQADRCILNYQPRGKGRWIQVSRPLRADEPIPAIFGSPR